MLSVEATARKQRITIVNFMENAGTATVLLYVTIISPGNSEMALLTQHVLRKNAWCLFSSRCNAKISLVWCINLA